MTALHCFIVSPAGHSPKVALLVAQAQQLGWSVDILTSLDALISQRTFVQAKHPIVLLADTASDRELAANALHFAESQAAHAYLVYIGDSIDANIYKQLLRTQAAEWIKWDLLSFELPDVIKRFPNSNGAPPPSSAKILTFYPSKGGVGNTTLAIEVAICLATMRSYRGSRIALLDLNLEGGTLADSLNIEARFDIHEIASHPERLDNQLIDVFASRHSDRLDVFATLPRRVSAGEIAPQMIFAVLDLLSSRYDVILIDLPNHHLLWNNNLLLGSDVVILSGTSTVPALKQVRAKLALLDELKISESKIAVIINQCEKSLLGQVVRRKEISRALPGRQVFFIREDVVAVRAAANAGRPLMELSSNSYVSKDIRKLVNWIVPTIGIGDASTPEKH